VLDGVKKRTRKLSAEYGDRFARWVDLDARAAVSDALSVDMASMRLEGGMKPTENLAALAAVPKRWRAAHDCAIDDSSLAEPRCGVG